MIKDAEVNPCYDAAAKLSAVKGEDFVVRRYLINRFRP
jgi:hypothetical protein